MLPPSATKPPPALPERPIAGTDDAKSRPAFSQSLAEAGQADAALDAARKALQPAPHDAGIAALLVEIEAGPEGR